MRTLERKNSSGDIVNITCDHLDRVISYIVNNNPKDPRSYCKKYYKDSVYLLTEFTCGENPKYLCSFTNIFEEYEGCVFLVEHLHGGNKNHPFSFNYVYDSNMEIKGRVYGYDRPYFVAI